MARPRSPGRWLLCELLLLDGEVLLQGQRLLGQLLLLQSLRLKGARVLRLEGGEHCLLEGGLLRRRPVALLLLLGRPVLLLLARRRTGPHSNLARPRVVDGRPRRLRLPPLPPPPLPVEELAPPNAPGELLEEPRPPAEGVGADPPGSPPEEAFFCVEARRAVEGAGGDASMESSSRRRSLRTSRKQGNRLEWRKWTRMCA